MKIGNVDICDECGAGVTPHTAECSRGAQMAKDIVRAFEYLRWPVLFINGIPFPGMIRYGDVSARPTLEPKRLEMTFTIPDYAELGRRIDRKLERVVVLVTHEQDGTDTLRLGSGIILRGVTPQYAVQIADSVELVVGAQRGAINGPSHETKAIVNGSREIAYDNFASLADSVAALGKQLAPPPASRWWCNWCGHELTVGQEDGVTCPHCQATWCGDECCGAMPVSDESLIVHDKRTIK